jgi:ketopantoate reductase
MARNILILGASYGSLLGTKLLMAGHNVTLVCRARTAELINRDGTEAGETVDAAHRQLPLHHAARAAIDPRRRAH